MKRLIEYHYNCVADTCGCCHYCFSQYSMWEDDVLVIDDCEIQVCEDEIEIRKYLSHLEPFDVDPNSRWFG